MCHIVLILPLLGLVVFLILPLDIAVPVYAVILSLSIYMYITVMKAMKKPVGTGKEEMLHEIVNVLDTLKPSGHVRYQNEIWNASSEETLRKGDKAEIVGLNGLTLIVKKIL